MSGNRRPRDRRIRGLGPEPVGGVPPVSGYRPDPSPSCLTVVEAPAPTHSPCAQPIAPGRRSARQCGSYSTTCIAPRWWRTATAFAALPCGNTGVVDDVRVGPDVAVRPSPSCQRRAAAPACPPRYAAQSSISSQRRSNRSESGVGGLDLVLDDVSPRRLDDLVAIARRRRRPRPNEPVFRRFAHS